MGVDPDPNAPREEPPAPVPSSNNKSQELFTFDDFVPIVLFGLSCGFLCMGVNSTSVIIGLTILGLVYLAVAQQSSETGDVTVDR